jgi:DNA-binding response OmpR family regulator
MNSQIHILLVEDDKSMGPTLKERLELEDYSVHLSASLQDARTSLQKKKPNLVILDLGLPDGSGFSLAEELVKTKNHPAFLFLTALANAPERLKGYELGAAEFIPKPFHLKELLIRITRVLKSLPETSTVNQYVFHGYTIHFDAYEVISPSGETTSLGARDCGLLALLIAEKHRVVSRDEILDKIWGEESFPTNRTIDNAIVRLRASLGEKGTEAIKSVRSVGYRWVGES